MISKRKPFRAFCWFCVVLALSTCAYEACLAQVPEDEAVPDSLDIEVQNLNTGEDPLLLDTPADTPGEEGRNIQPLYRKWWVWALVTTAIAVTAVLVGGGDAKETEEDLPGFPDPPNR
jgi:hypothetical protein